VRVHRVLLATNFISTKPQDMIIIESYFPLPRHDFRFTNSFNLKAYVRHSNDAMTDLIKTSIVSNKMTKEWMKTLEQDVIHRQG
jgi:hypothetical protein